MHMDRYGDRELLHFLQATKTFSVPAAMQVVQADIDWRAERAHQIGRPSEGGTGADLPMGPVGGIILQGNDLVGRACMVIRLRAFLDVNAEDQASFYEPLSNERL